MEHEASLDGGMSQASGDEEESSSGRKAATRTIPLFLGAFSKDEPETPVSVMLRRSLLRCARDLSLIQDQIDCAELLLAADLTDEARILYDVIFIRTGFSPRHIQDQAKVAARTRLWGEVGWERAGSAPPPRPDHSIDIAVAQLRQMLTSVSDIRPLPEHGADIVSNSPEESIGATAGGQAVAGLIPNDLGELCEQLCAALRQPGTAQAWQDVDKLLMRLHGAVLSRPSLDCSTHVDAKLPFLAAGLAFDSLRHFLVSTRDLAFGPFGSAGLFHAAARLERAGLGPYFTTTAQLLRSSRDLFGMIQLAAGKESGSAVESDMLERWTVLLSQHFHDSALHDLVDDLADLGLMRAIWGICDRAAEQIGSRLDAELLWCIRDAGLDNDDLELALRAQRLVVRWRPDAHIEWRVLGEIEATAGNHVQAEQAFVHSLSIDPGDQSGRERLEALREGQFGIFEVEGGFGTPNSRKLIRHQRRQIEDA